MNRKILVCLVAFSLMAMPSLSHAQAEPGSSSNSRETLRNSTGVELLGNSLLYSFYYQRMLNSASALDVGLGIYGGGDSDDAAFIAFIPFGLKFYLIPKNGSIYLTGGGVFLTGSEDIFDEDFSTLYGYAGLGFEHRSTGGFVFRFTAYGLIFEGGFFIWPGLTIGYAF